MRSEIVVAVVSAVVSLVSVLVTALVAYRTTAMQHLLQDRTRERTQQEQAEQLFRRYREPLLQSAHSLQSRLFNALNQDFLTNYLRCGDPSDERYARDHTVYLLAAYLGWVDIVWREQRFLDIATVPVTRDLLEILNRTTGIIATNGPGPFRLFRGEQRAIGELMQVCAEAPADAPRDVLGYAAFCERLDTDSRFASWFDRLRADVDRISRADAMGSARLVGLQAELVRLVNLLDPHGDRLPAQQRRQLAEPGPGTPRPSDVAN